MEGDWCQRCTTEYNAWPQVDNKCPSGLLLGCIDADSGRPLLLFGREKSGFWCHPHGNADSGDRDNVMAACREAAEETCFGLGPPRHLKTTYFDTGKASLVINSGAWLIEMGTLSGAAQMAIVARYKANLNGALWRKPRPSEVEMTELRWCDAREFLEAVKAHSSNDQGIQSPSLDSQFRRWLTRYYKILADNADFLAFCSGEGAALSEADAELLDKLLTKAKNQGSRAAVWDEILDKLSESPSLARRRRTRSYAFLHHAAYWGQVKAVQRLVSDFHVDVQLRSKDGETAAKVAAGRGHGEVEAYLSSKGHPQAQLVGTLLTVAKLHGRDACAWNEIFTHLSSSSSLVNQRNGRSYSFLHHAAYWGQLQVAQRLVNDYHADLSLKSNEGKTAADIAAENSHDKLAKFLREKAG